MTQEHFVTDWDKLEKRIITASKNAVRDAMFDRDCAHDCAVVQVVSQKVDDNKEMLTEVRDNVKSHDTMMKTQLWVALFSLIGVVFTLFMLLSGIR